MFVVLRSDTIMHPTEMEIDPAVVDHLQLALQTRLKIFCSRSFDFDESKGLTLDSEKIRAAMMVDSLPELSSCLPPHYRGLSHQFKFHRSVRSLSLFPVTP